jgi:hypothetical protein
MGAIRPGCLMVIAYAEPNLVADAPENRLSDD